MVILLQISQPGFGGFTTHAPLFGTVGDTIIEARFVLVDTVGGIGTVPGNTENARILRPVPTEATLNEYFGWTGIQLEGTGRFRTAEIDGYWYLIDPLGNPFFSVAPNSVNSYYPNIKMPEDLIEAGFNTLGNWSSHTNINSFSGPDMPYVTRVNFLQGYKNTTQRTKDLYNAGVIAVFDPEFVPYAANLASEVIPMSQDPYCIGIFSDNELPNYDNTTYGNLLDRFLAVPENDPNHIAADAWMVARKGENYTIDATDREEFHGYLMGTYYRIVGEAIDAVAPDLLYLGSRLHGGAKYKPSLFREAGKYLDVISINFYGPYEPASTDLEMWLEESNKPFLITEYYAKAYDVGMANASGAGNKVPTQTDRAIYFENFSMKVLESRGCVGVQWHRFQDDINPYVNKGFINENGDWYAPLKASLYNFTKDMYGLREYMKPLPEGKFAAVYDSVNFLGSTVLLSEGAYTAADLSLLGVGSADMRSVKLKSGYKAVLYSGNELNGDSVEVFVSDGYLGNNGLTGIGSMKIAPDYRIVVEHPMGSVSIYKPKKLEIDLSGVFLLLGDEAQPLLYTLEYVSQNAPFTATVSGSSLQIAVNSGNTGSGEVIVKAEYDGMRTYDTLQIELLQLPWNAAVKDTYIRGSDYNGDNYGTEPEVLVKLSTSDLYRRIGFLGFDLDPQQLPEEFNVAELVVGANSKQSTASIGVFGLEDYSWNEYELTWLTQPTLPADPISTQIVSTTNKTNTYRWDVSDFVVPMIRHGDYAFSLVLQAMESVSDPVSIAAVESGENFATLEFGLIENVGNRSEEGMYLYPNPADEYLTIGGLSKDELTGGAGIFSVYGTQVAEFSEHDLSSGWLNIEMLPEGVYLLQIKGNEQWITRKFIRSLTP
jgi:hypothetical protein